MDRPRVAGVAGGVGTTTVAVALHAVDGGVYPGGVPVHVLVCRSTMTSLASAQAALNAAPAGRPPVLAVVGDGAPLTSAMRASLRMTEPHASAVVHVPHVAGMRDLVRPWDVAAQALGVEPPKELRRFVRALEALVDAVTPVVLSTVVDPLLRETGPPEVLAASARWPTAI